MKYHSRRLTVFSEVIERVAEGIGAEVYLEPEWGCAGYITLPKGKRTYFRYNTLDINSVGASEVAKDKDYASHFMAKFGYCVVPESKAFLRDDWAEAIGATACGMDEAYAHAEQIHFPVIIKPNSSSQGRGVACVHNKEDFYQGIADIFELDRIALVQSKIVGNEYRIVVLDDAVVAVYARVPLSVVGDGVSTVRELFLQRSATFAEIGRRVHIRHDDSRIVKKLSQQGLSIDVVVKEGARVFLLDNANLSTGGDLVDVTAVAHGDIKKLAITLTKDMGLRLSGVDIMITGDIEKPLGEYWIIEINASPGLDHYAHAGPVQKMVVENLYRDILLKLDM